MSILQKATHSTQTQTAGRRPWLLLVLACLLAIPAAAQSPAPATPADPAAAAAAAEAPAPDAKTADNPPPEPPPRPDLPAPDTEAARMQLLAARMNSSNTVWLEAGGEKFLALYQPDVSGTPRGAALLLHAEGEHPDWPATIDVLRRTLPEYGWATLAISLPSPDLPQPPPRDPPPAPAPAAAAAEKEKEKEDGTEQEAGTGKQEEAQEPGAGTEEQTAEAEPPESEVLYDSASGKLSDGSLQPPPEATPPAAPVVPTETRTSARISAAMSYLQSQGQLNIALVGAGTGAARGAAVISTIPPTPPLRPGAKPIKAIAALVIINGRNQLPTTPVDVAQTLFDTEIPTLDIYFDSDLRNASDARIRQQYARQQRYAVYQQVQLPAMADTLLLEENRLSRRVRGFLQKYAQGMEMQGATMSNNRGNQ